MPTPTKDYDFQPATVARSAQVNANFDELYNLLKGLIADGSLALRATASQNNLVDPAILIGGDGQVYFEVNYSGAVIRIFKLGDLNPRVEINNLGYIRTVAGYSGVTPSTQYAILSSCLYSKSNSIGNVGGGEDNLHTFDIGMNVFGTSGGAGFARVTLSGNTAANGNNKRIRFYGKTTALVDSGVMTENNKPWFLDAIIIPNTDSFAELIISGSFKCGATDIRFNVPLTGYDFTQNNTWKITAEAVADSDVVQNVQIVTLGRGAN